MFYILKEILDDSDIFKISLQIYIILKQVI